MNLSWAANTDSFNGDYWGKIAAQGKRSRREDAWRNYLKEIYRKLIVQEKDIRGGIALKTDLYDEAITSDNLFSMLSQQQWHVVGMDYSLAVAQYARQRLVQQRNTPQGIVVTDIRRLPFKDNSFDAVVSNSTLDHFACKEDIIVSLKELYRILKPQEELIITLDNPTNPVVRLRNMLPYWLLKSSGIIPFYMGVTLSKSELIRVMQEQGFKIKEGSAIVHCPRFFAIWIGSVVAMLGSKTLTRCFSRFLGIFEFLEKSPLRYLSGYFICVKAAK